MGPEALELVRRVGLPGEMALRAAHTYSGGNKRKLSLAIALAGRPAAVLLDEPSSGAHGSWAQLLNDEVCLCSSTVPSRGWSGSGTQQHSGGGALSPACVHASKAPNVCGRHGPQGAARNVGRHPGCDAGRGCRGGADDPQHGGGEPRGLQGFLNDCTIATWPAACFPCKGEPREEPALLRRLSRCHHGRAP